MTAAGRMGPLLRVGWVIVALILVITGINLVYVLSRPGPYQPWKKITLPYRIAEKTVRVDGGLVLIRGDKCVAGTELVPFTFQSFWVRMDRPRTIIPYHTGGGVFDPKQADKNGCLHFTFKQTPDPAMTNGRWRLEGRTCATRGAEIACQGWYTETFTMIPREILNP